MDLDFRSCVLSTGLQQVCNDLGLSVVFHTRFKTREIGTPMELKKLWRNNFHIFILLRDLPRCAFSRMLLTGVIKINVILIIISIITVTTTRGIFG